MKKHKSRVRDYQWCGGTLRKQWYFALQEKVAGVTVTPRLFNVNGGILQP
jgi:hypothetical protein